MGHMVFPAAPPEAPSDVGPDFAEPDADGVAAPSFLFVCRADPRARSYKLAPAKLRLAHKDLLLR
eukprot:3258665-Alexandrium_andersonii.AAC.1